MFQLSSLMITGVISYSLYQIIVKSNFDVSTHEKLFISLCFIIPLILTPLPLITESYGDSNGWCWIIYHKEIDTIWMIIQFYGPLMGLLFINIYFYYKIYQKIWLDSMLREKMKLMKKLLKRLKMYPIVLIICFGPSLVHRIYYLSNGDDNPLLNLISACFNALYGFCNAIVYGFTGRVRKSVKIAWNGFFHIPSQNSLSTVKSSKWNN